MNIKKDTVKKVASYSVANYLYTAINAVSNIFVSNILGPVNNGVISYFNALNSNIDQVVYSTFRSSVERTVPQILDYDKKVEYTQQACVLNLYATLVFSLIFVIMGLFTDNPLIRTSAYFMSVLNITRSMADFYRIWIRSQNKISVVAVIMIITAICIPCFAILLSYLYGLNGFWIGRIVITCISFGCFLYASKGFFKIVPIRFDFLKHILISGGEIVLFALCISGVQTMDKYFIEISLGLEQLGFYAIGSMVFTMLMLVPSSIIGAIYPKFVSMVTSDLKSLVSKYSIVVELLSFIVAIIAFALIPWAVDTAMPKYVPSVPIIRILLVAFVSYASVQLRYIDIIRKKRMKILIRNAIIAFAISVLAFVIMTIISTSIKDFAWCTVICFILLSGSVNLSWSQVYELKYYKKFILVLLTLAPLLVMLPLYLNLGVKLTVLLTLFLSIAVYTTQYRIIKDI